MNAMTREHYDQAGRFVGDQGSPAHKAHIAKIAFAQDKHDVIEALLVLDDPAEPIEKRAIAARDVESFREDSPNAYAEGLAIFETALAQSGLVALKAQKRPFSPSESAIGDVFTNAPPAPSFIVDRLLPRSHGLENAIGGAGKTTRHIWEAAHLILGRDLYGQRVLQPGPVLVVTKEDDEALFRHRIHQVVTSMTDLSPEDRRRIADNLHLLVLTGTDERLASVDRSGNIHQTDLVARLVQGYRGEGLALVELDPFNLFGPGERFVNDGEAAALSAMARLSHELKSCVRATSHISKAVARDGTSDAHSGRGGSAGGDNSRFVWNYWRFDAERDKGVVPPELVAAAEAGELFRLHVAKLTAAKPATERIWITRQGFAFDWKADAAVTPAQRRTAAADADDQAVLARLRQTEGAGYYTARELESDAAMVGVSQKRVRAAVIRLLARGKVEDVPLPADRRRGGRQTYLRAIPELVAELDTGVPMADQITGGAA